MKPLIRGMAVCALAGSALMLASCQSTIGFLVNKLFTTETEPAKYKVPKGKKILTLVESSLCETDQPIGRMLTDRLNGRLESRRIAAQTIPYEKMLDVAAATPGFGNMRPSEAGKRLGADLVCYVMVHSFKMQGENIGGLWRGQIEATVSMFDASTGRQLWPIGDREGYWVDPVRTPPTTSVSPNYANELSALMCDAMAEKIVGLFCDHQVPTDREVGQRREYDPWGEF